MKKLITLAALAIASLARAGDYHEGTELKCYQCHTMHASRAHGIDIVIADNTVRAETFTTTGGFDNLLKTASTNETCLGCHASGGIGVYGVVGNAKSGGNLNGPAIGTVPATSANGYTDGMGHTMGFTGAIPGSAGTITNFNCADCHAVHGNAAYRNLGDTAKGFIADQQPTYSSTTTGATVWDFDAVEQNPEVYDVTLVAFGNGGGANRMNAFCAKCHGNFHGETNIAGTGTNFKRHPTGTATDNHDMAGITAVDIVRPVQASATNGAPGCLTCHKAHGTKRAFGLVFPGIDVNGALLATNTDKENGDFVAPTSGTPATRYSYNVRSLCITCHTQGR